MRVEEGRREEKAVYLGGSSKNVSPRFRDIYSLFGGFLVGSFQRFNLASTVEMYGEPVIAFYFILNWMYLG